MVDVNWSDPLCAPEGVYKARVKACEVRHSKSSGDAFFKVTLANTADGEVLCDDVLMVDGKGRGIGTAKLKALGFGKDQPTIDAQELVGRTVYIAIGHTDYQGQPQAKVDIAAKDFWCGYLPEAEYEALKASGPATEKPIEEDPTPF